MITKTKQYFNKKRGRSILNYFLEYIGKDDKVLDIGCGDGYISDFLIKKVSSVTSIDIVDKRTFKKTDFFIFDGITIPFNENEFTTSLLVTVLHHTQNPEKLLSEVARVSKKIIIVEDTYNNNFHKFITYFFDSLLNLEFFGHPHSNKNTTEWKNLFKSLDLEIKSEKTVFAFPCFYHTTFVLEKN